MPHAGSFLSEMVGKRKGNQIKPAHLWWWVSFCLSANILSSHNTPSFL